MRSVFACALLLLSMPAASDDAAVYESIDDLSIGPVFLTPGERRWLDANRHLSPQDASGPINASTESDDDSAEEAKPAGFIINSSGQARQYRNGEFSLSNASPSSMRFPDDVVIRRHVTERETDTRGRDEDATDDETSD